MAENDFDIKRVSEELEQDPIFSTSDEQFMEECKKYVAEHKNEDPLLVTISDDIIFKYYDKVYDYLKDKEYCASCPGLDKCEKRFPQQQIGLNFSHNIIERSISPCELSLEESSIRSNFQIHDFPEQWSHATITDKDFDRTRYRNKAFKRVVGEKKSAYIYGLDKTGKTYFAAVLANELARSGQGPICFINAPIRIKEISDAYKQDQQDLIKRYQLCNVLIIDNFGDEYTSDYIRDAIISPILEFRYSHDLITILVSHYHLDEIRGIYGGSSAGGNAKASRLVETIRGACGGEIEFNLEGAYR
ncbi:MAG: hypothetical protein LUD22_01555 [Coprobacillus sp.]|nr:hypothetical protein [Coprobacillus sp.]